MNLSDIFHVVSEEDSPRTQLSATQSEAQIMELREWIARTVKRDRQQTALFAVGDVVTPRSNAPYHGAGLPHIVTNVLHVPEEAAPGRTSDMYTIHDMRVICLMEDRVASFAVDSVAFEHYIQPQG